MSSQQQPSGWMVWLGLADNSFTRQKTVKFGDASAVNSGRGYGVISVLAFIILWWVATAAEWINPIYWPGLDAVFDRVGKLANEGFRNIALWDHIWISVYRVLSGVVYGALIASARFRHGAPGSVPKGLFDPLEFARVIPT